MKSFILLFSIVVIFFACNQQKDAVKPSEKIHAKDTAIISPHDSASIDTDKAPLVSDNDSIALLQITQKVLASVKNRDYKGFANFIHPQNGVQFSNYAFIDTTRSGKSDDLFFTKERFVKAIATKNKKTLLVGFDASDEPTKMSLEEYFKRFVYDVDFLNAKEKGVNHFLGGGNSLNNLRKIYPDDPFTENYTYPDDEDLRAHEWRTLRLVYKKLGEKYYLIAVVHDEWTI